MEQNGYKKMIRVRLGLPTNSELNEPFKFRYIRKLTRPVNVPLITSYVQERKTMFKKIALLGFLSLFIAFNATAHENDRIEKLEKEIQELKLRITKLESLLSDSKKTQELVTPSEGWKSVVNWRKLSTDMETSDVRKILGEPDRVDGGRFTTWYYLNDGDVVFLEGKVYRWMEPRE